MKLLEQIKKFLKIDKYSKYRRGMEKYFKGTPESVETVTSPSGDYSLRISTYKTGKGTWSYSRGEVFDASHRKVADVKRNYSRFPYSWVEDHPNGHDYLLCGEDYQGQTVVELDTGNRVDYRPPAASRGAGFCWASVDPSPNKKLLAVDGCYWGASYEVVVFDFSDPMELPYKEIARGDSYGDDIVWSDDSTLTLYRATLIRKSDLKPYDSLTDAEQDALLDNEDENLADMEETATVSVDSLNSETWKTLVWKPTGRFR